MSSMLSCWRRRSPCIASHRTGSTSAIDSSARPRVSEMVMTADSFLHGRAPQLYGPLSGTLATYLPTNRAPLDEVDAGAPQDLGHGFDRHRADADNRRLRAGAVHDGRCGTAPGRAPIEHEVDLVPELIDDALRIGGLGEAGQVRRRGRHRSHAAGEGSRGIVIGHPQADR